MAGIYRCLFDPGVIVRFRPFGDTTSLASLPATEDATGTEDDGSGGCAAVSTVSIAYGEERAAFGTVFGGANGSGVEYIRLASGGYVPLTHPSEEGGRPLFRLVRTFAQEIVKQQSFGSDDTPEQRPAASSLSATSTASTTASAASTARAAAAATANLRL